MVAPAPQVAPAPAQQRRGLLEGFFGPEGRDTRQRLAIALEGLALNPNQALIGQLQSDIESRKSDRQKNATVAWLRSRGRDDLAAAIEGGLPAAEALRIALTPTAGPEIREVGGKLVSIGQNGTVSELYAPEVQPGYRQVTGAQLGLTGPDAQKLFNVSPDGQVTAIGGAGTTVNVDTGAGGKFEEAFAKGDAATIEAVSNAGMQAVRNIGRINQLDTLLQSAPTGAEGALKLAAGEFGINTEGLSDIQSAQAIINSLVPEQRAPGSGPMSDADLALFKQSLPRIINQPGGNQTIVNTMRAIAEYDAQGAVIVQRLRAGEIDRAQAFQELQNRKNPLSSFKAPAGATPTGSQPVVIDGVTIRKVN
jgi:hypothetical protein